jgi:hypothetical protein
MDELMPVSRAKRYSPLSWYRRPRAILMRRSRAKAGLSKNQLITALLSPRKHPALWEKALFSTSMKDIMSIVPFLEKSTKMRNEAVALGHAAFVHELFRGENMFLEKWFFAFHKKEGYGHPQQSDFTAQLPHVVEQFAAQSKNKKTRLQFLLRQVNQTTTNLVRLANELNSTVFSLDFVTAYPLTSDNMRHNLRGLKDITFDRLIELELEVRKQLGHA